MASTQRAGRLGGVLFGLIFFAAGMTVVLFFPVRGELRCGGEPAACALESGGLVTRETQTFAVADIADVVLDEHETDEGDMTQRPVLVLKSGDQLPVREAYSNIGDAPGDVARIRAWLAAPTGELSLSSSIMWTVPFGMIFVLVGAFVMYGAWFKDPD